MFSSIEFSNFPLFVNLGIFGLCAIIVWSVGSRLTLLADVIAGTFGISRSTIGLLFLALATSLPEVATTLTAAVKSYQPLVLNNLFGGIALQTAILAIADGFTKGALSNYPRKADHAREAVLLISLLSIVLLSSLLQEPAVIFQVGLGSIIVTLAYIGIVWLLRNTAGTDNWIPVDLPDVKFNDRSAPLSRFSEFTQQQLVIHAVLYCAAILIVGVALVLCAAAISSQSGLGESFVGATFLAAATSLPEFTTTITAIRMGAFTLAISNIFGSNLIMLALLLPADILYRNGPILRLDDTKVLLAIGSGILVSTVYITGLLIRRKPRLGSFGIDSIFVLAIYSFTVFLFYISR